MHHTHSLSICMHVCPLIDWVLWTFSECLIEWVYLHSARAMSWAETFNCAVCALMFNFFSVLFSLEVSLSLLEKVKLKKFDSVNWNYFNFQQSSLLRRRSAAVYRAIVQRTTCATHSNGDEVAHNIFLLLFFRVSFFSLIFTLCTYLKRKFPHSKLRYYPQSDIIGFSISRTVIVAFASRVKWLIFELI